MSGGGLLSGGIVFAIAAVLWIIYLVPTWLRRNEYLATERNAVRLQQTLRILAETAEAPQEIRVEAKARDVAAQQKILKRIEAEARERARLEEEAAVEASRRAAKADVRLAVARARRRARLTTTLVMGAALVSAGFGGWLLAVAGEWMLLAGSALVAVVCVSLIVRMARVSARVPVATAHPVAAPVAVPMMIAEFEDVAPAVPTWTPTPLPKPLHLSEGTAAAASMAQADAHEALRRAALAQVMAERAAEQAPVLPSIRRPVAPSVPAAFVAEEPVDSRFSAMGIVDETEIAQADVTSMLRRRRVAS